MRPGLSVIIPTLQASDRLLPLVHMYCKHSAVGEVIIINNSVAPLQIPHPKVRVLQQAENIYVNPAWNLGVKEAQYSLLLISNDDISISPRTVSVIARILRLPLGVVGMHVTNLSRRSDGVPWFVPTLQRTRGYGTLMGVARRNYVPIPESLRVWYGDDWLMGHQRRLNVALRGVQVLTKDGDGESVSRSEIQPILVSDTEAFNDLYRGRLPHESRFRWLRGPIDGARRFNRWCRGIRSKTLRHPPTDPADGESPLT